MRQSSNLTGGYEVSLQGSPAEEVNLFPEVWRQKWDEEARHVEGCWKDPGRHNTGAALEQLPVGRCCQASWFRLTSLWQSAGGHSKCKPSVLVHFRLTWRSVKLMQQCKLLWYLITFSASANCRLDLLDLKGGKASKSDRALNRSRIQESR